MSGGGNHSMTPCPQLHSSHVRKSEPACKTCRTKWVAYSLCAAVLRIWLQFHTGPIRMLDKCIGKRACRTALAACGSARSTHTSSIIQCGTLELRAAEGRMRLPLSAANCSPGCRYGIKCNKTDESSIELFQQGMRAVCGTVLP